MNICLSARTDIGVVRDHNEDNFLIVQSVSPYFPWDYSPEGFDNPDNGLLILVADGMGGTNAGEVASSLVVSVVEDTLKKLTSIPSSDKDKEEFLKKSIHKSKKLIVSEAKNNLEYNGMGTTVIMAWIIGQNCHIAWAGDSRAYRLNKKEEIEIISEDHSLVWELMKKGILTEDEAETHPDSNIITQSLSDSGAKLKPDSKTIRLEEGDKFLLCSDGLNGMVSKPAIAEILIRNKGEDACTKLVEEANNNGGTDNITVVLCEVGPFWVNDNYSDVQEEPYEPITLKTTKVSNTDFVENPSNSGTEVKKQDNTDIENEKLEEKPGFFKTLWKKITSPDTDEESEQAEIISDDAEKDESLADESKDKKQRSSEKDDVDESGEVKNIDRISKEES